MLDYLHLLIKGQLLGSCPMVSQTPNERNILPVGQEHRARQDVQVFQLHPWRRKKREDISQLWTTDGLRKILNDDESVL